MAKGPDISTYQGDVNFDELKKHVDFVMIRSSYGNGFAAPQGPNQYKDAKFDRNRNEARRVGLARGYYHYCYPNHNSPESEADYFKWVLGDLQRGEVLALDFEEVYNGDKDDWCYRFLKRMQDHYGFKPLLYINLSTANERSWNKVIAGDFGLWVAVWNGNEEFPATKWPVVAMKQYTDSASVGGINGKCDMNVFNGDVELFKRYGYLPAPIEPPKPDVITYLISFDTQTNEKEFSNKELAEKDFNDKKTTMEEGKTIYLTEFNKTQNKKSVLLQYTKPVTPDVIIYKTAILKENNEVDYSNEFTSIGLAQFNYNLRLETLLEGQTLQILECNKTTNKCIVKLEYIKPIIEKPKPFNLIRWIIDQITKLFNRN